jgi:hypothetical protein
MSKYRQKKNGLGLSLTPAFFASGCCATLPILFIFGVTLGEEVLMWYQWYFRIGGIIILFTALLFYFYKQGIQTLQSYRDNWDMLTLISVQTILYTLILYFLFTNIITPVLWYIVAGSVSDCCSINL